MHTMTICLSCGHRVMVAPGFCHFCGEVFQATVLRRQVTAEELQHKLEMEWYVRVLQMRPETKEELVAA